MAHPSPRRAHVDSHLCKSSSKVTAGHTQFCRGLSLQLSPVILLRCCPGRSLLSPLTHLWRTLMLKNPNRLPTISISRARPCSSLPVCLCHSPPGPDCRAKSCPAHMPSSRFPSPSKHRNWSLARTPIFLRMYLSFGNSSLPACIIITCFISYVVLEVPWWHSRLKILCCR